MQYSVSHVSAYSMPTPITTVSMASEYLAEDTGQNESAIDRTSIPAVETDGAESPTQQDTFSADGHTALNVSAVDGEEEEDSYDPESAIQVSEPTIADSAQATMPDAVADPASEFATESTHDPELPPEPKEISIMTQESHELMENKDAISNSAATNVEEGSTNSNYQTGSDQNTSQSASKETKNDFSDLEGSGPGGKSGLEPESDDDYDPEKGLLTASVMNEEASSLPSKPTVPTEPTRPVGAADLREAYDAVMQSEVVRLAHFSQISKEKQMEVIQDLLREKHIELPGSGNNANNDSFSSAGQITTGLNEEFSVSETDTGRPDIMLPMTDKELQEYEQFLDVEADFLKSKEELPENSRLFVGNLATNVVKKQDLFRLFKQYGELLEISLKTGYGFAQFRTPEACAACKNGESGKPLYNRMMRLDSSHKRKATQASSDTGARGRERSDNDGNGDSDIKRSKTLIEDVCVIATDKTSTTLGGAFEDALQKNHLTHTSKNVGSEDPTHEIRDAAYLGVLGACVIKETKVDLQIFEETGDGGVKFDEYLDIEPLAACDIVSSAKRSRTQKRSEIPKSNSSRRSDRSRRSRQSQKNVTGGHQDDRRRNIPDRPSRSHNHARDGNMMNGWQRNNGRPGPLRGDWGPNLSRANNGYDFLQGNGGNSNMYPSGGQSHRHELNYPQQGYDPSQFEPDNHFRLQGRHQHQGYNHHSFLNNRGNASHERPQFGAPSQGGLMHFGGQLGYAALPPQSAVADPALMQTLQNLDPTTMRSVVALLQQQNGTSGPPTGIPNPQRPPVYQNSPPALSYQHNSPSAQVNSLLTQIQSQPPPLAIPSQPSYSQQPQQPYSSASLQQAQPNQALMDMLSRLEGQ